MGKITKKQKEQIKSLTWSKFYQYKVSEIIGVLIVVFIPYYLGLLMSNIDSRITNWFFVDFTEPFGFSVIWAIGFLGIVFSVMIIAVPILWICFNWNKAKENAEEEVTEEEDYY